jgi:hypothetical protein
MKLHMQVFVLDSLKIYYFSARLQGNLPLWGWAFFHKLPYYYVPRDVVWFAPERLLLFVGASSAGVPPGRAPPSNRHGGAPGCQ